MGQHFEGKIAWIEQHIAECDKVIQGKNVSEAKKLQAKLLNHFSPELPQMRTELDRGDICTGQVDYLFNIDILKGTLTNYIINLRSGLYRPFQKDTEINLQQMALQTSETTVSVSITLEQAIENINQLPESVISTDDKELLAGKLAQISAEKEPESRWEKAKGALKWIADKGFEVGIAALPYIVQALTK